MSNDVVAHFSRLVAANLPAGTRIVAGAAVNGLPPHCRYWLIAPRALPAVLVPQAGPMARPLIGTIAESEQEAAILDAVVSGRPSDPPALAVGFAFPRAARWPILDRDADNLVLAWWVGTRKYLIVFVRTDDARPLAIAKRPLSAAVLENCAKEHALLAAFAARGLEVAPAALASGTLAGAVSPVSSRYFLQEFLAGAPVPDPGLEAFVGFLKSLRQDGRTTSARAMAKALDARIGGLRVGDESKRRLARLLGTVRDDRRQPAAVVHGDLGSRNLHAAQDGRLVAIDWEYADSCGLGFLDLVDRITSARLGEGARSFADVFGEAERATLARFRPAFFDGEAPPMPELVALHLAKSYIDRVETVEGVKGARMARLESLLRAGWPF
ncbi:MAG: aminoglycoside phosphotransferase family protein [Alphaproteobacteria bacterium]